MKTNGSSTINWTNWIELPASDFLRAKLFYETIFSIEINILDLGILKMGIFPHDTVGVALCCNPAYTPSESGVLVYLNAEPDLNGVLSKIEKAGGKILRTKTQVSPEFGYMALFIDPEGNRIALKSMK